MNYTHLIELKDALRNELNALAFAAREKQASTNDAKSALIEVEMSIRDIGNDLDQISGRVRETLLEILEETGETKIETDVGSAYITKDTESVSYNSTAIETLCISDPTLAERLKPFRKINTRRGGLVIRR